MSRAKAAQRVAAPSVAASLAALLSPARAEASRRNGARSRGPVTTDGKARSARNALKHGLCAAKHVVVEGESAAAFAAFEQALVDDLAPEGALQTLLAGRIARCAWRLERAERIEAELFARKMDGDGDLGLALTRDGNNARAFDTLLRYRGAAQAELFRTLRTLRALQAEAAPAAPEAASRRARPQPEATPAPALRAVLPNQPEARRNPGDSRDETGRAPAPQPAAQPQPASAPSPEPPIEPKSRANADESRCEAGRAPVSPAPAPARPAAIGPALAATPPARAAAPGEATR